MRDNNSTRTRRIVYALRDLQTASFTTSNLGGVCSKRNSSGGSHVSRQRIRAAVVLTVFVAATALTAALVAMIAVSMNDHDPDVKEQAQANESKSTATTSAAPSIEEFPSTTPPPTTAGARGETGKQLIRLQVNPGDCVEVTGAGDTATLGKVACGSGSSTYKIIDKTAQCPSDADRTFHQTPESALCLDIDWVVGGCMELVPNETKRIDCAARGTPNGARVVEIKQRTVDVNTCSKGDRGIVYQERKFVVCVARM
ncbi:hypothetical protein [Nocardia sp. NPDC057440]|uniref:LppU family putative lipoprotein n=1 Tax=Nocardia sp. NPDC057440 TaxID=3346134 RepID=UPI00366F47C4